MADPGNTFRQAQRIFIRSSIISRRETLSARGDTNDWYRFRLTRSLTSFDAVLGGIEAGKNLDLLLYKDPVSLRSPFAVSSQLGNAAEGLRLTLEAGTYYLRVFWRSGTGRSGYILNTSGQVDRAGQGRNTARPTGRVLTETGRVFGDYIGRSDRSDFYRFRLEENRRVTANLTDLSAGAEIEFYDRRGVLLDRTPRQTGADNRTLSIDLTADPVNGSIYFARVTPAVGVIGTRYTFSIASSEIPDSVGNTREEATPLNIGFSETSFSESVGGDDPADVFSFTNSISGGDLNLKLTNTTSDLLIALLDGDGNLVNSSNDVGGVPTLNISDFPTGEYFLSITSVNGTVRSDYTLTALLAPPDNVGDTATTAGSTLITTPGTTPFPVLDSTIQSYEDFVGGTDEDVFRFEFNNEINFLTIELDPNSLTSNVDLEFFREGSANRVLSSLPANEVDAFVGSVGPGTFYLRVFSTQPSVGSGYTLNMSVSERADQPTITRDVNPIGDSNARLLTPLAQTSTLFFAANDGLSDPNGAVGLWKSGGALDDTIRVGGFVNITGMVAVGNTLYIAGDRTGTGLELYRWTDDGSEPGAISLVADITPSGSSDISELTAVGNTLYFLAAPAGQPQERTLYRSDGTANGTAAIPNSGDFQEDLTLVGTTLYYRAAQPGESGTFLWEISNATSSTSTPTRRTTISGVELGSVETLQTDGTDLYFVADEVLPGDVTGNEEWRRLSGGNTLTTFDNGDQNTSLIGGVSAPNRNLVVTGNYAYFTANDQQAGTGAELFRANLTTGNTELVDDINEDTLLGSPSNPDNFVVFNGNLFFSATDNTGDTELYVVTNPNTTSVGSINPTKLDFVPGGGSSDPTNLIIAGGSSQAGRLYFVGSNDQGTEIWSYDPTDGVATSVNNYETPFFDIQTAADGSGGTLGSDPQNLVVVGDPATGRLYFTANDGDRGREVWVV